MNAESPIEDKPPRAITLYVPAALAVLLVGFSVPNLSGPWQEQVDGMLLMVPLAFLFLWPFVLAGYHGYRLAWSLFHRHPPD